MCPTEYCLCKTYLLLKKTFSKLCCPLRNPRIQGCPIYHLEAISAKASPLETKSGPCLKYGTSSPLQIFLSTNASIPTTTATVTITKTSTNTMASVRFIFFSIVWKIFLVTSNWFSIPFEICFFALRTFWSFAVGISPLSLPPVSSYLYVKKRMLLNDKSSNYFEPRNFFICLHLHELFYVGAARLFSSVPVVS